MTISEQDRQRIEAEVAAYRRKLEWLYEMAYIQGQIDQANEDTAKIRSIKEAA